jgi:hypothetical protein
MEVQATWAALPIPAGLAPGCNERVASVTGMQTAQ